MFHTVELLIVGTTGQELPVLFEVTATKICKGFLLYNEDARTFMTWTLNYEDSNAETCVCLLSEIMF